MGFIGDKKTRSDDRNPLRRPSLGATCSGPTGRMLLSAVIIEYTVDIKKSDKVGSVEA